LPPYEWPASYETSEREPVDTWSEEARMSEKERVPARQVGQDDASFFEARGFGLRIGFGTRPAVVVVDFSRAFTDPDEPLGSSLDSEVAATARLLAAAREAEAPIFYTVVWHEEKDLADAGVWIRKQRGIHSLRRGSKAEELDPRLGRLPDEATIVKKYASAFFGTDLVSRLNSRRIDTLVIAGCTTSGCVRATAVDAVQYGFIPIVVRDAVGDRSASAHTQSLFDLEQKYADVTTVDETVEYLAGLRTRASARA
jgi:nicotinamidase-related amidase